MNIFFTVFGYTVIVGLLCYGLYLGIREMYLFFRYRFDPSTIFDDNNDWVEPVYIGIWSIACMVGLYYCVIWAPFTITLEMTAGMK